MSCQYNAQKLLIICMQSVAFLCCQPSISPFDEHLNSSQLYTALLCRATAVDRISMSCDVKHQVLKRWIIKLYGSQGHLRAVGFDNVNSAAVVKVNR